MSSKIELYKTFYNKPICEGREYFVIMNDLSVVKNIAGISLEPKEGVLTRFLTQTGVNKYIKKKESEIPEKTEEEKLEEIILSKNIAEQLDYVQTTEDFDKWIKRNKLNITKTEEYFILKYSNGNSLFYCKWSISELYGCCGGREQRNHGGSICPDFVKKSNDERNQKLLKYLAPVLLECLKKDNMNYGLISYVKQPGQFSSPSGRIGIMLSHLDCFTLTGKFKNPNTSNILYLYAINDKWADNM